MESDIISKNKEPNIIEEFVKKVQIESGYRKFLKIDIIQQMIATFKGIYQKKSYPNQISNSLEITLQFYKNYNSKFYNMIESGIENNRIIISRKNLKSYTDTSQDMTYIRLYGNDGDLFLLVHEFAHYIDRNSIPRIIPNGIDCLSEVFSFYMEKQLELWLPKDEYNDLISARRNNRLYFESRMLKAVEYELYYEKKFRDNGKIDKSQMDIEKIKLIMSYSTPDLVNYLIRYPLANILSEYLIKNNFDLQNEDLCKKCFETSLYSILHEWNINIEAEIKRKI